MNNLINFLEKIQKTDEAVGGFAIDSFPDLKKKKKKRKLYFTQNENIIVLENKRAMIDLDGTIHKYSKGFQDGEIYDEPFDGAKEVIEWLKDNGYEIVIFTTRASKENAIENNGSNEEQIKKVGVWLKNNGIYFDRITAEKLGADFYIDDKAITIKNGNWNAVLHTIKKRIKYAIQQ